MKYKIPFFSKFRLRIKSKIKIDIYSDGSAVMAKKPGGFGWVLVVDGKKHSEGNGFIRRADNNDAELEAALIGLKEVQKLYNTKRKNIFNQFPDYEITLCSDSKIVLNWVKGTHVFKNEDKYKRFKGLKELVKLMNVQTKWIRAHAGTEHNERCDELAHQGRLNQFTGF